MRQFTKTFFSFAVAMAVAALTPGGAAAGAGSNFGTIVKVGKQSDGQFFIQPSTISLPGGCGFGLIYWSLSPLAAEAFNLAHLAYATGRTVRYDYSNTTSGGNCTLSLIMIE